MKTRTAVLTFQAKRGSDVSTSLYWLSFTGALTERKIKMGISDWCAQHDATINPNRVAILNLFICEDE